MPNWCENLLIIRGSKKEREEFKKKYCETVYLEYSNENVLSLIFNNIIPEPKTPDEYPEEYIIHNKEEANKQALSWEGFEKSWFNWYKWRCFNWGTKWPGVPVHSEETETSIEILFETAWAPPTEIIEHLILDNYKLKISLEYNEPGMGVYGKISYLDYENPEEIIREDK